MPRFLDQIVYLLCEAEYYYSHLADFAPPPPYEKGKNAVSYFWSWTLLPTTNIRPGGAEESRYHHHHLAGDRGE